MIISELPDTRTMALRGWLTIDFTLGIELKKSRPTIDFCTCSYICDYEELTLVWPQDITDEYRNDYRSVLVTLLDASSTYSFKIIASDGTEIPLVNNDYGKLFDVGFNTVQPLKAGYRIDWYLVYDQFGPGKYQIEVSQTDFGNTVTSLSHTFNVQLFDELRSNLTVKLEWIQKGAILNGEDYGGMSWPNMVRLRGRFGSVAPEYEINRLIDSFQRDVDIQTTKYNRYTLTTQTLPDFIGDELTDNAVLTDEIFVSVNDIFNYKQYRKLPVTFDSSVELGEDYATNNRKLFTVSFKDVLSLQKRNFIT